jgi:hypothetical protein
MYDGSQSLPHEKKNSRDGLCMGNCEHMSWIYDICDMSMRKHPMYVTMHIFMC